MNWKRWLSGMALSAVMLMGLPIAAQAADYGFTTAAPQDFYKSGSYEEVYGSQYNYGGKNVVDYQIPELEYGLFSATQTGVMERTTLGPEARRRSCHLPRSASPALRRT